MRDSYRSFLYITIITLLILGASVSNAAQIWVAPDGDDESGNGTFGNPYRTISRGLVISSPVQVDTVMVRAGTYLENVNFGSRNVVLMSESGSSATTIQGVSPTATVIFGAGITSATVLDGFEVRDGYTGGISVLGTRAAKCSPEIRNCFITENGSASGSVGGGLYLTHSESKIHDNVISGNSVTDQGAGIYASFCGAHIYNNIIKENNLTGSTTFGGGIYIFDTTSARTTIIQNNLILTNSSTFSRGGGAYIITDNVQLINNVIAFNSAESGGGVAIEFGRAPLIRNNIFHNNSNYALDCFTSGAAVSITQNCFFQNSPEALPPGSCPFDPELNVFADPRFVSIGNADFRLQESSPLIDEGGEISADAAEVDFDGRPRVTYGVIDIGAYEWSDCELTAGFDTELGAACIGVETEFLDLSSGRAQMSVWDYGNGDIDTFYAWQGAFTPMTVYASVGDYDVTVTVNTPCTTVVYSQPLSAIEAAISAFASDTSDGCAPLTVQFTNQSDGSNLSFFWDFGDADTSRESDPVHVFTEPGNFTVRLVSSNGCGEDSSEMTLLIRDVPTGDFAATSGVFGSPPLLVTFADSSSDDPNGWLWDFGDGRSSTEKNPINIYSTPGQHDVSLIASNECGDGEPFVREKYVTIFGFELSLVDTDTSDRRNPEWRFAVDSLYGLMDDSISLSSSLLPAPRRGEFVFQFAADTIALLDTTDALGQPSGDLARGEYNVLIIGSSVRGTATAADTLALPYFSEPDTLILLEPGTIAFDSVEVDSVSIDSVRVRNVAEFPKQYDLSLLNVISSDPQFVLLDTAFAAPLPAGGADWVRVEFHPAEVGPQATILTFVTDDPATPEVTFDMTGVGIPERNPPTVSATLPLAAEEAVLIAAVIEIELSEEIDSFSLGPTFLEVHSTRTGMLVEGAITLQQGYIISFVPSERFAPHDTIDVVLEASITDIAGNTLDGDADGVSEGTPIDDFNLRFFVGPAVYPGDCNNDGVVNEVDVLPVGVFYGMTGPNRLQFEENTDWGDKQALPWDDLRATYADADGNGTIDEGDLLVIALNWSNTHQWSDPVFPVDFDYSVYNDKLAHLIPAIESMSGSEMGELMSQVLTSIGASSSLPTEFQILQNYPNPFNPITRINYALPQATEVRLTVHNILGQTVRTLVDGFQSAGFKTVLWDGTDEHGREVSSGVYFYRFESGEHSIIRKMVKVQ